MFSKKIILGSSSPRRKELIESLGLDCEVRKIDVDEVYPPTLKANEVPEYLSKIKAEPLKETIKEGEVLLTSDTVVILDDEILGKPTDKEDAFRIIKSLSGYTHEVVSGVCLYDLNHQVSFSVTTKVGFKELTKEEIEYYIDKYQPYDKAGAYGIQEWIGMIGVETLEGSFYNVMGLPVDKVWEVLQREF